MKAEPEPKHVVSTTRRDFPWSNTHHVEGDLTQAVKALKKATPRGLLVGKSNVGQLSHEHLSALDDCLEAYLH